MRFFNQLKFCFIALAVGAAGSPSVSANTGETYGFGSRASALGNSMLGGIGGGFGTYYNPGANSALPGLNFSYGISYAHPSFLDIKGVTVQNSATSAVTGDVVGDVDTSSYLDHLGQVVAGNLNMGEKWKNLTLGAVAFMPISRVAYIDSGEAFLPEYFSYRSRTQRPQIFASASVSPFSRLHLGTGLAFATNLSATTTATASSANQSVSYQRFASTIKPSVVPYFSIYSDPKPFQFGLTLRLPNIYKVDLDINANTRLLGQTGGIGIVINSGSSIYYDPEEVDAAAAYQLDEKTWFTVELDWLQYKAFQSPALTVTQVGGISLNNSISDLPTMRNIFVPKVGLEHVFGATTLRAGYFYRPSPVADNSGPGNLVDPAKHVITAGLGIDLKEAKLTDRSVVLDAHAQYHFLVTQHITKAANNEVGVAGQTQIGSPGYDIGGKIYGGGVSLTLSL